MDDVLFRWRTEGVRLNGRFSIDSQGHKNMQTTSQITSSLVEAKGGVVGGQVNLHKFNHTCMYYCYSPKQVIRIHHVDTSYSCSHLHDQTILTTIRAFRTILLAVGHLQMGGHLRSLHLKHMASNNFDFTSDLELPT